MTIPKLHITGNGKLSSDGDKLKIHSLDCCATCVECEDSKAPKAFKVVLDGFSSVPAPDPEPPYWCDTCARLNRSYIVPWLGASYPCLWSVTVTDSEGCYPGGYAVQVSVAYSVPADEYTIKVYFNGGPFESAIFTKSYAAVNPSCTTVTTSDVFPVTFENVPSCDSNDLTCTVISCN